MSILNITNSYQTQFNLYMRDDRFTLRSDCQYALLDSIQTRHALSLPCSDN